MSLKVWGAAIRFKTLPAAISPVVMGLAVASHAGFFHMSSAIVTLLAAIGIQIGTNFANDYYDYKNGADTQERQGPLRPTSAGLISPLQMKRAMTLTFLTSFMLGLYLAYIGGPTILIIGILSIISGYLYTGGPYPLGYNGLGDLFVLIFFGPIAVGGTAFIQTGVWLPEALILGFGPGLLATAILVVNNIRDVQEDKQTGKRTLVVRWGITFGRIEYVVCMVIPLIIPILLFKSNAIMCLWILAPMIFYKIKEIYQQTGAALNDVLAGTAKILVIYAILFSILLTLPSVL